MNVLIAHDDHDHGAGDGTFVGSGLYDVSAAHTWGLVALAVLPLLAVVAWRWRDRLPAGGPIGRLRLLSPERQVAVAALTLSGAVHAAIVPAHGWSAHSLLFAVAGAMLWWAAWLVLGGRRFGVAAASAALLGSLSGLAVSASAGETPDQVAMITKLVELTGLVALWAPMAAGRARRVIGTVAVSAVATVVAVPVWGAALSAHTEHGAQGEAGSAAVRATAAERAAADELHARAVEALAKYANPAVAAADGYAVDGIRGRDFHATHAGYGEDGRVLDPERPEQLVYAESDRGPLLLGAMWETKSISDIGPQVGGPLTVWHRHEQVCFTVLPPTVVGMTSPYGVCPLGSATIPWTGEMLHVWTVPGAPSQFGDIPEEWLDAYVEGDA